MGKKNYACVLFLFMFFEAFSDPVLTYKYNKNDRFNADEEFLENKDFITIDKAVTLKLYSAEQIFYFINNWPGILKKFDDKNGDYHCYYDPFEIIQVNNMILTKALFFRAKDNWYLPGFCIYVNLDDEYRRLHTYIKNFDISTVFDENGMAYLLEDKSEKITFYKLRNLDMSLGVINSFRPYCINFINKVTNQIMFYEIETGITDSIKNIPVLNNPVLYFGEKIDNPQNISELRLVKVDEDMSVVKNGIVYRNEREIRGYDGTHIFDTIYLLDYTSDGTRKKGVYKIMGDRFEFYPDL